MLFKKKTGLDEQIEALQYMVSQAKTLEELHQYTQYLEYLISVRNDRDKNKTHLKDWILPLAGIATTVMCLKHEEFNVLPRSLNIGLGRLK